MRTFVVCVDSLGGMDGVRDFAGSLTASGVPFLLVGSGARPMEGGAVLQVPCTEQGALQGQVRDATALVGDRHALSWALAWGMSCIAVPAGDDAATLADQGAVVVSGIDAFGRFRTAREFWERIDALQGIAGPDLRVRYGHNLIRPWRPRLETDEHLLSVAVDAAKRAREHAYAPYSRFKVGAAVVSAAGGRVYAGCNVENGSYGATICAERNAVLHAVAEEGAVGIDLVVVVTDEHPPAPPCAACLQVLSEFSRPETAVHLVSVDGGSHRVFRFGDLLPHPFVLD